MRIQQYLNAIVWLLLAGVYFCGSNSAYAAIKTQPSRTINLVNQCPFPVWFGFSGSASPSQNGSPCSTNADCYPGSACVNIGAAGTQCFWQNPAPTNGNFKLAANGGSNSVLLPAVEALNMVWSGAVAGRTNCTSTSCQTADCGNGQGNCPAGRGFGQPATQAEFTLLINGVDSYDVEVINGVNIPVAMAPNLTLKQINASCQGQSCDNPYFCGAPGSTYPVTQVGRCHWDLTPPSNDYNWVTAGGAACTSNTNCTGTNICGISFNPGQAQLLKKTCGTLIGYWTANEICGINPSYGAPFNCSQPLPAPQQDLTLTNLYLCTQVGSCYSQGAPNTCCGCANWDKLGANVPASPFTTQCVNANSAWTASVQPTLLWIKDACPTAYVYPFDDMSSSFTCQSPQTGENAVNYTITFCPGNMTGGI